MGLVVSKGCCHLGICGVKGRCHVGACGVKGVVPCWHLRTRVVQPKIAEYQLWTHCRYKAPEGQPKEDKALRKEEKQQFAARMRWTHREQRQEEMLSWLVTALQVGLPVDAKEVTLYVACDEGV